MMSISATDKKTKSQTIAIRAFRVEFAWQVYTT